MKIFYLAFADRFRNRPLLEVVVEFLTGIQRRISKKFIFKVNQLQSLYDQDDGFLLEGGLPFEEISSYEYNDKSNGSRKIISHSSRRIFKLSDLIVDIFYGNIFNSKKVLISESTIWSEIYLASHVVPFPLGAKKLVFDKPANIFLPSNSFYHFLLEDFPDFLRLFTKYPNANVIIWNHAPAYVIQALQSLNIDFVQANRFLSLETVIFVEKSKTLAPSAGAVQTLKHFASSFQIVNQKRSKVYISRVGDARSPAYERDLIDLLELSGGWTILNLSRMSFGDQLAYANSAIVWVGHHGAGLSWIPFLPSEAVVIEIGAAKMDCFQQLAFLSQVPFYRVRSDAKNPRCAETVLRGITKILEEPTTEKTSPD